MAGKSVTETERSGYALLTFDNTPVELFETDEDAKEYADEHGLQKDAISIWHPVPVHGEDDE